MTGAADRITNAFRCDVNARCRGLAPGARVGAGGTATLAVMEIMLTPLVLLVLVLAHFYRRPTGDGGLAPPRQRLVQVSWLPAPKNRRRALRSQDTVRR